MSYTSSDHDRWVARQTADVIAVYNAIKEWEELKAIYTNESASGADANFVATPDITKHELIDGVTEMDAIKTTVDAQISNLTPFLNTQPD